MRKYHIHIKADTDDHVKEELREVAHILAGLREATKKWDGEYGYQNRALKKKWEAKADEWLNKHKVFEQ